MATHHHHQCQCLPTTTTTTTCYCTMCYTTTHYPPPSNPLIHHHHNPPQLHQHAPPQNHHTQHYNHYPPPPPQTHQKHHLFPNYYQHENVQETPPPLTPTVSSLIHRIAALESSLRRRKHSPTSSSSSLRDAAARTIQTHFRAFLVRRSVTLRHLKHLAHIKSALNHLKSSVSSNTHFDSHTLSRESLSLRIKLDSIQGSDPMIRDGKRAISRELIQFMEVIDEMCTESEVIAVKNVKFGKNGKKFVINERKVIENLKNQRKYVDERFNVENPRRVGIGQIRIGELTKSQGKSKPKVKKNVSFDENGNVYRLFKSSRTPVSSDGSGSSNGDDENVEAEVEEIGVSSKETEVEEDDSSEMSENEMDPRKNLRTRIHRMTEKKQPDQDDDDDEDDSFVFSAPLPAKMEY